MSQSPKEAGPGLDKQSTEAPNDFSDADFTPVSDVATEYPRVRFTVGRATDGTPQTKRHNLGSDGKVATVQPVFATRGTVTVVECGLDQVVGHFKDPASFLILGVPAGVEVGKRCIHTVKGGGPGIARTTENYTWPEVALMLLDLDLKEEGVVPSMQPLMEQESQFMIATTLATIDKELKSVGSTLIGASRIARRSASSNIMDGEGNLVKDSKGVHVFLAVKGKTPGELLDFLHKRLVIAGQGYCYVASNGHKEIRTVIDKQVGQPNRVSFEAPAVLGAGLTRKQGKTLNTPGAVLDLTDVDLVVDKAAYDAECRRLKGLPEVADLVKKRQDEFLQAKLIEGKARGLSEEAIRASVARLCKEGDRTDLYPKDGQVFRFDDGREANIADILEDPGAFHDCSMMDPSDLKERPGKARFYWNRKQDALGQEQFIINLIRSGQTVFLHGEDVEEREPVEVPVSADDEMVDAVRRLAELAELDYDRVRGKEAEALGVRVTKLDKAVNLERDRLIADDTDDSDGRRPATLNNVVQALKNPIVSGAEIAFDEFTATQVWTPAGRQEWQEWTDAKSVEMRMRLAASGLKEVSKDIMRDALVQAADSNRIDTAQIWANKLPAWDGTPRCESFFIDHFGAKNTTYSRAVGLYTWSALAGRIVDPGAKADMIPTLIGAQGARKSSGVEAMAPTRETFVEINLHDKEDDLKRNMVGTLVGEIGELAGFNKREMDWFKSFSVRKADQWIPKWCERRIAYRRRLLFIATTNHERFLKDETGERRWLPLRVGAVDVDGIIENRDQLWAEAFVLYRKNGVMFSDAEELAKRVVGRHKEECPDADLIQAWLDKEPNQFVSGQNYRPRDWPYIKTIDVGQAIGIEKKDLERAKGRMSKAMRLLGYTSEKRRFIPGQPPFHAWVKSD